MIATILLQPAALIHITELLYNILQQIICKTYMQYTSYRVESLANQGDSQNAGSYLQSIVCMVSRVQIVRRSRERKVIISRNFPGQRRHKY